MKLSQSLVALTAFFTGVSARPQVDAAAASAQSDSYDYVSASHTVCVRREAFQSG
jgi:hypothetical protein